MTSQYETYALHAGLTRLHALNAHANAPTYPHACTHAHTNKGAYPPAESCRVKSLDVACFIFASQTLVIGRGRCCFEFRDGCREADSFS